MELTERTPGIDERDDIGFSASDQAGIARTAVYQDGEVRREWQHPSYPDSAGHSTEFTTGASGTILDQFLGTQVKVAAEAATETARISGRWPSSGRTSTAT